MHILFTEEELEWIDKQPFNWTVKEDCPDKLKKVIKKKLDAIYKKNEH